MLICSGLSERSAGEYGMRHWLVHPQTHWVVQFTTGYLHMLHVSRESRNSRVIYFLTKFDVLINT